MENEHTIPRQLSSTTIITTLIETGLAVWAFSRLRQHWPVDLQEGSGRFWALLAAGLFLAGLVLTNVIGMVQTLRGTKRPISSSGEWLPVRLQALDGPNTDVATGLAPLSIAFLAPIYPLFRVALVNLYDLNPLWAGACLVCLVVGVGMVFITGRQVYLMIQGAETAVEISAADLYPGQAVQLALMHKPGRSATQQVIGKLVCCQTTRKIYQHKGKSQERYQTAVLHEQLLAILKADTNWEQQAQTTIPTDAFFSTEPLNYPQVDWTIEVIVKVSNAPDYRLQFPIRVLEPATI